jgi:hypothetical protein
MAAPFSQSRGRDGSPFLPPCHTDWIDVADVRAQSTLTTSGPLHGLDGKEVKMPSMQRTISVVGFEWLLRFTLWYK